MRRSLRTTLALLVGIACSPGTSPVGIAEERAVLAAVIDSLYGRGPGERLVVRTTAAPMLGMAAGYARRTDAPCDLRALLTDVGVSKPIEFLTDSAFGPIRGPGDYWNAFYLRYPNSGGLIVVSCPAFDSSGNEAMVQIGRACGGLCGASGNALLRRRGNRWTVVQYIVNRMS